MLALAAEVLLAGTARARQNFRPPAIEVEDLGRDDRKIAQLAPVDLGRGTGSTGERGASSAVRTITSGQRLPSPRGA
ncbi:hypothetical protein QA634_21780 [Methylobacterium sp. CB376]|nr:hypothetical protein [Methylobacterium nodulans]WFT77918.1 hypothetical protein QA634_21780 [Methylobacterium nodulans]